MTRYVGYEIVISRFKRHDRRIRRNRRRNAVEPRSHVEHLRTNARRGQGSTSKRLTLQSRRNAVWRNFGERYDTMETGTEKEASYLIGGSISTSALQSDIRMRSFSTISTYFT